MANKGIDTLIKLNQRNLDELRKQMVQLEDQKEALIGVAHRLQQELQQESDIVAKQPGMLKELMEFAARVKKRQQDIAMEVANIQMKMNSLSVQISDCFGELKKFEITKENRLKAEDAKMKRQESQMMDDVAIGQFSRKQDS